MPDLPEQKPGEDGADHGTVRPDHYPSHASDSIEKLLLRMQNGDKDAAGAFIARYQGRILRRVSQQLGRASRRIFDSQDIFSTLSRRLVQYVHNGQMTAPDVPRLMALITVMTKNAVLDKLRIIRRLERTEGPDSEFAVMMLDRIRAADANRIDGGDREIQRYVELLDSQTDRDILTLWLLNESFVMIADELDLDAPTVRKRWQRIRAKLAGYLKQPEEMT